MNIKKIWLNKISLLSTAKSSSLLQDGILGNLVANAKVIISLLILTQFFFHWWVCFCSSYMNCGCFFSDCLTSNPWATVPGLVSVFVQPQKMWVNFWWPSLLTWFSVSLELSLIPPNLILMLSNFFIPTVLILGDLVN